jgi:hypothetical protein
MQVIQHVKNIIYYDWMGKKWEVDKIDIERNIKVAMINIPVPYRNS